MKKQPKIKKKVTIENDLKEISKQDLLNEDSFFNPKTKKILLIFSSFFMLFLIFSLVYIKYPLFNILLGQTQSKPLQSNILNLKEVIVFFQEDSLNKIFSSYENSTVETSLCLQGHVEKNQYFVTSAYVPKIFSQSYNHVIHESCSSDTIILFHTHPYKNCLASSTDLKTLEKNKLLKPEIIMIIMCEPNRFSLYK